MAGLDSDCVLRHPPRPRAAEGAIGMDSGDALKASMTAPSPRRRFQFRLRTLMIGVTLLCVVGGGYVLWQKGIAKERQAILDDVLKRGGIAHADYALSQPQWQRVYLSRI